MFDKKHHIVTTWKANIYFKVILLKSGSLLLMCQHTHRGSYMDFGGGSHKISAVVKCDGYVSLGFFLKSEERSFCFHQIFRDFHNWQKGRSTSHTDTWAQAVCLLAVYSPVVHFLSLGFFLCKMVITPTLRTVMRIKGM